MMSPPHGIRMPGRLRAAILCVTTASVLALLADCGGDGANCPTCPLALIEGTIMAADSGMSALIAAQGAGSHSGTFRVWSDSSGRFVLQVPPGRYRIFANISGSDAEFSYRRDGIRAGIGSAEVVELPPGPEPSRVDFRVGLLRVKLHTPAFLDSQSIGGMAAAVGLQSRAYAAAVAVGGFAELFFPIAPGASYRLKMSHGVPGVSHPPGIRSDWEAFWLPATLDTAQAAVVGIPTPTRVTYEATLPEPGRLRGTIHGSWEILQPHHPPEIGFFRAPDSEWQESAGEDGRFEFLSFVPVDVRLAVSSRFTHRWIGGRSYPAATSYRVRPGEITEVALIEGGILCRLEAPGDIVPDRLMATLVTTAGDTIGGLGRISDADRLFTSNLEPGTYLLRIENRWNERWASQWYDGASSRDSATPITISPGGQVSEIAVHLVEGGSISGRLHYPGTQYASVLLYGARDSIRIRSAALPFPPSGMYTLAGLEDGAYKLAFELNRGEQNLWFPGFADSAGVIPRGTASWDSAAVILIVGHAHLTGVDWRLP